MKYRIKQFFGISIIFFLAISISVNFFSETEAIDPFFTLVLKTSGGGVRPDYGNLLKQQLEAIGINVDVINQNWPSFVAELIAYHDYDIVYIALTGGGYDPDFTGVYDENGSLNLFGYHTSMDYNETLGTGLNEWYIREGTKILPPDSQKRIQHYWDWQQHLMDKILPCLPTFAPKAYTGYWANLQGYNATDGILQSWGKMSWDGSHLGQVNTSELVISDAAWSDLNPLFQDDTSSYFISSALMDSLVVYDSDLTIWPHLATNWTHITDTQVRIKLREGIKWQTDPDNLFPDEYFDAEDVYFTYACWNSYSASPYMPWLDHMEIIDDYTIDFFIDGDDKEPGMQISNQYLPSLRTKILPEHYLNQSQCTNGIPDITHPSWNTFATKAFGTSLFKLSHFQEDEETILTVNPNSWWLNSTVTNDPNLDWERRFGDFTGSLNQLRVKIIPDLQITYGNFRLGLIDIMDSIYDDDWRAQLMNDTDFEIQSEIQFYFGFFGYNMRPERPVIGNPDTCPGDSTMTIGLAIRKAISYAADIEEINNVIHSGEYTRVYHPIYVRMGIWCNPNIIKYDHDIVTANQYMRIAGYTPPEETIRTGLNWLYSIMGLFSIIGIFVIKRRRSKC